MSVRPRKDTVRGTGKAVIQVEEGRITHEVDVDGCARWGPEDPIAVRAADVAADSVECRHEEGNR